jgi:hypothetical protein
MQSSGTNHLNPSPSLHLQSPGMTVPPPEGPLSLSVLDLVGRGITG